MLGKNDRRAHAMAVKLLTLTIEGKTWSEASAVTGFSWMAWNLLCRRSTGMLDLYHAAQAAGAQYRQQWREEQADRRAFVGWEEPVYQGGRLVGVVKRFSDRLAEVQLGANRPEKYREQAADSLAPRSLHVHFHGMPAGDAADRAKLVQGASKVLPAAQNTEKPEENRE